MIKSIYTHRFFPVFFILFITFLVFHPFFLRGLHPFPGNYMLAWFEPWKSAYSQNGSITIQHKPIADDVFRQLYPMKILGIEIMKKGEVPLWNPYNGGGQPLLATMHIGLLNPLNLFFFFFDSTNAWSLQIILTFFLIGLFTYFYCRKIKISRIGALFSTTTFLFSGFVITRTLYNDYNYAIMCLPLLLYIAEDYFSHSQSKKILLLPLITLFLFTVVQPQIILYVFIFLLSYIFLKLDVLKISLKRTFLFSFLILLGIGLASIQLFPTIELFIHANINSKSSLFIFDRFLIPLNHLITLFIPNYFGNQAIYNYWGTGDYVETVTAIGSITIFFGILSFLSFNHFKKLILFLLASIIVTLFSTIKTPLTEYIYTIPIPILSTSIPTRIYFLTTFSFCILAGLGFDQWLQLKKHNKYFLRLILGFSIIIFAISIYTIYNFIEKLACNNNIIVTCRSIALRNLGLEIIFLTFTFIFIFLFIFSKKSFLKSVSIISIFVILIIQGIYNSSKYLPFTNKTNILPENKIINQAQKRLGNNRFFGIDNANIKTNFATYYKFFDPNYYDPLYIKRYGELIAFSNHGRLPHVLSRSDIEIVNDNTLTKEATFRRNRLFSLLNITHTLHKGKTNNKVIYIDNGWYLKKQSDILPKAKLFYNFETISNDDEVLKRLFNRQFNSNTTIIIEKALQMDKTTAPPNNNFLSVKTIHEGLILLNTKSSSDSLLLLTETYFPGWNAYIDGVRTEVLRANYTFRAISLPKGEHEVIFAYQPSSFLYGTHLSLFFFFLYILLIIIWPKICSYKNK